LTAAAQIATPDNDATTTVLEADARTLAETQRDIVRAERTVTVVTGLLGASPIESGIEQARKYLASNRSSDTTLLKAGEWFLDNYYLVRRAARQVTQELPGGFVRRLPHLAKGAQQGMRRIDVLARALTVRAHGELHLAALQRFVLAYQEVSPLTIAELWALPTMLRVAVLHQLLHFLRELKVPIDVQEEGPHRSTFNPPAVQAQVEPLALEPVLGVERSIRALRLLAEIDWKAFFEKTNRVEAVLKKDPADVYPLMDFGTCDSYRKVIEELAWATATAEEGVAELALALAREQAPDERRGHVGYYLIDQGRAALEDRLGYRPRGIERVRRAVTRWPTLTYLSSLTLLTGVLLFIAGYYLVASGARPFSVAMAVLVAAAPGSVIAVAILQSTLAHLLPPRILPKLDFTKGLPDDARTLVVIPTLLGRPEDAEGMIRQIELHYLANPDSGLEFALLTDDLDSPTMPENAALLDRVAQGIARLNSKHGRDGPGPFHLLHREPRWNASEGRFMGWERKRGKLEELNRLLRGDKETSFARQVGEPKGLLGIRFVITLDSDTQLPMGSAHRLVGLFAHPLNRAVLDDKTGRVVSGYTIVQPRIETSPSSVRQTRFSRIFAGDVGFDIYTHAVSDFYQDLFGSGIYVGKGIYEVDAFMRSVEGRVPENALASHDLFEGVHGRTALATDIVFFDEYPSHYAAYTRRMHRWVRGDWQLFPWLFATVPSAVGERLPNPLVPIDRWKIFDNLRRSLTSPLLFLLLLSGWTWLPASPLVWTLGAIFVLFVPVFQAPLRNRGRHVESLERGALELTFLAHETVVIVDAAVRAVVRMAITHKRLLQWTSAAQTAHGLGGRSPRSLLWREMLLSFLLSMTVAAAVALTRPSALFVAAPFLVLWLLAPEIARWLSEPLASHQQPLNVDDWRKLRLLARRTWLFFETFVGPNDQWLPVDNYQEEPREQTAHRTSPTNIGMMLISTLSAYDLGYLGPSELSMRLRRAFESITRLSHYRGHLLNWYETKNLKPLLPEYVSTVDSGNLAGCLLALKQGCIAAARAPAIRAEAWDGLADSLDLLEEVVESVAKAPAVSLRSVVARMRSALEKGRAAPDDAYPVLRMLCDEISIELDRELLQLLETGAYRHEAEMLHALRTSMDRLHQHLQQMRRELDSLLPWLALRDEPAAIALELPTRLRLDEIPDACRRLLAELDPWEGERRQKGELSPALATSAHRLKEALLSAQASAETLQNELSLIAARAEEEVRGMDFRLLYDRERKLFHIGYNVTLDQVDAHHYDLLASEARLASYLAIVKRDVPESHWYALGRPMTDRAGSPALLSWGGTMFEYLMPNLLMRSREGTLLAQTCELVVETQIAYGKQNITPWGISESAYSRLDAHQTYQYQSFGVPGLGFKRGLEDDLVITPYASLLALSIRPRAVLDNIGRLESLGMLGTFGLFEALDLHPERTPPARPFAVVRSYMAHHQGMLLVAIDNFLNDDIMVERFHSDPSVETCEMLLNERAPARTPSEWPIAETPDGGADVEANVTSTPAPWSPAAAGRPQAFVVSNGRLTSLLTDSGGGGLSWQGLALTRYQPDVTCDEDGVWIYLRDEESGRIWLATSEQGRTTYALHKAEFHRREQGISLHVDVAVAASDDVEVRQITLHNETDRPRKLSVTSAGEPVLLPAEQARSHPAFSKMFVESERIESLDALLFARRARSREEGRAVLVHRLVWEGSRVAFAGYETDRAAFFGRSGNLRAPQALAAKRGTLEGRVGTVLDPVMSLMASVALKPNATETLAFVTTVARSRTAALELARRYGSMHAVRWAFLDAAQQSRRQLQEARLEAALLPAVQRLFSALLFADPTLRPSPQLIVAGRPCKRRLWGRGISGDDPILLVHVNDAEAPLLSETIAAHRLLRSCGIRVDLVLVDEQASGYVSEGAGTLRNVLARLEANEWLNRRGGIFLLAADQLSEDERRHLDASARVVLDTRDGSLASRLVSPSETPPRLPRLEPTLVDEAVRSSSPRPKLLFDNGTGGFTEDGTEYVLFVRPGQSTPAPWCNVLANPEFGCLVSESSLGATWSINSGENRLTPWRNDPVFDVPSEALYLRDEETAVVWSPTPLPAGREDETVVRHGAGYTTYSRQSEGLEQELTIFVPADVPLKVARLRLKNTLARHRRLTATYYAEWALGSVREEQRPYIASEFDRAHACLLASCSWNAEFGERVAFLASELEVHGFTTDRTEFLGRPGDYARPEALRRWGLTGRAEAFVDPCAVLQVHLELDPGEQIETHFVLGQAADRDGALKLVARFQTRAAVDEAWNGLGAYWNGLLGAVRVKTPEPSMDLMLNRWLLYQTVSSRLFGRTGFYQSSGAFGYRDQLQDVLALLHAAPERTRAHILEAAAHQFDAGDVLHWWHPPSGRGVRTRCSDDMAWLPFVTADYVFATGDASILSEPVPFLTGAPLQSGEHDRYAQFEASAEAAPLFEHCRRALERARTSGLHGLPLMGDGDWNDSMNRVGSKGQGESVWLGWFLSATMDRFATLCERMNERSEMETWRGRAESLRATIERTAWDGAWYLRAFHDDGSVVGSAKERECRIDSIAQSWAVLSRASDRGDETRARLAVQAAGERLVRDAERLVLLLFPPFDSTAHDPGYIRAYPPGVRENGGQYTHAATWLGWAYATLGDGERAERIFRLLNPILRTRTTEQSDRYRVEPYVLAGDVYSCPPWVGRGGWTWYTGAAAWAWRLGVEGILGLRKENGQLCIDPSIPPAWPGFEAWVRLGAQQIHVVVENTDGVGRGVATVILDGTELDSNRIRLDPSVAGTHEVQVRLGSKKATRNAALA